MKDMLVIICNSITRRINDLEENRGAYDAGRIDAFTEVLGILHTIDDVVCMYDSEEKDK